MARNESNGTWLDIIADGYGGLANAVYDGASIYNVTASNDGKDYVTKWIDGHNYLINDLVIKGSENNSIVTSTKAVSGIVVGNGKTLTIQDLTEYSGFNTAVTVQEGGTLEVSTVTFKNNTASSYGGAIYNKGGNVTTRENVNFSSNTMTGAGAGGAIFNTYGSVADGIITIGDNNSFNYNKALNGEAGAIYNNYGIISMGDNISFNSNFSQGSGGAIYNNIGELTIGDSVVFSSNTSNKSGGAIYNTGYYDLIPAIIGDNATFVYNSAVGIASGTGEMGLGGAIYNDAGFLTVGKNVTFSSNTAKKGGAVFNNAIVTTIEDGGTFNYNSASELGGAIYNKSDYTSNGVVNGVAYLNLLAQTTDMVFTGNTAGGESNAIYDDHGIINLWAGDDRQIVFNDKIASAEQGVVKATSTININSIVSYRGVVFEPTPHYEEKFITESSGTGKIVLNEDMSGYKGNVNLYGGTLEMNADYDTNGYKFFDFLLSNRN